MTRIIDSKELWIVVNRWFTFVTADPRSRRGGPMPGTRAVLLLFKASPAMVRVLLRPIGAAVALTLGLAARGAPCSAVAQPASHAWPLPAAVTQPARRTSAFPAAVTGALAAGLVRRVDARR
jgi:hypothetical protein